jgi:hypothetical protein
MCHARQAKAAHPRSMDVPTSRSKTGFGVKGERFTPKAGHDPGIVSPEAGSRFCAEQRSAPAHHGARGGAAYVPGLPTAPTTNRNDSPGMTRIDPRPRDLTLRRSNRRDTGVQRQPMGHGVLFSGKRPSSTGLSASVGKLGRSPNVIHTRHFAVPPPKRWKKQGEPQSNE